MWRRQVGTRGVSAIGRRRRPLPDDAVVVEHRLAVGGEPHVALEAGGAEANGQRKASRVFSGALRPGAPVGEADRGAGAARGAGWARRPIVAERLKRQGGGADIKPPGAKRSWAGHRRAGRHGDGDQGELSRLRRRRADDRRPRGAGLHPGRPGQLRVPLPELPDVRGQAGRAPHRRDAGGLGRAARRVATPGRAASSAATASRSPTTTSSTSTGSCRTTAGSTPSSALGSRCRRSLWAVPPVAVAVGGAAGAASSSVASPGRRRPAGRAAALLRGAASPWPRCAAPPAGGSDLAPGPAPRLSARGAPVHCRRCSTSEVARSSSSRSSR